MKFRIGEVKTNQPVKLQITYRKRHYLSSALCAYTLFNRYICNSIVNMTDNKSKFKNIKYL